MKAPASGHPSSDFLLPNSNLSVLSMVIVKEHAARVVSSAAISWNLCCFISRRPSDFPLAAYEAGWPAKPNQTNSTLNQPIRQILTTEQVSPPFPFFRRYKILILVMLYLPFPETLPTRWSSSPISRFFTKTPSKL